MSNVSFIMNNISHISVLSVSSCDVEFRVLFITSLPTRCILTTDPFYTMTTCLVTLLLYDLMTLILK